MTDPLTRDPVAHEARERLRRLDEVARKLEGEGRATSMEYAMATMEARNLRASYGLVIRPCARCHHDFEVLAERHGTKWWTCCLSCLHEFEL
jgi:hypothetical protein